MVWSWYGMVNDRGMIIHNEGYVSIIIPNNIYDDHEEDIKTFLYEISKDY